MPGVYTKKQELEILRQQLDNERSTFTSHWRDLTDYVLPRRGRFFIDDVNRGTRKNQKIIDSTATLAVRTLQAGMMAGITSPSRPWFKLSTQDPDLAQFGPVKEWLSLVEKRMRSAFLRSNLYNALPVGYGDLGTFGTAAIFMEEDQDTVSRFYTFPIGSYMLGNDDKMRVRVFFREFRMTVRQVVMKWGMKGGKEDFTNISEQVQAHWQNKNYEQWVNICHVVRPNPDYEPGNPRSEFKRYSSDYYEKGISGQSTQSGHSSGIGMDNRFLSQKGYDLFPILAPRWSVSSEDVYATNCPGMVALGDVKQLQLQERRTAEAIEKKVRPPMVGPTAMKNADVSILPGDISYVDEREGLQGFRPAHNVDFDIRELEGKSEQIRQRIRRAYYEDLFLMLAESDRRQITATEVVERKEEKLLALGPVLEQLNQDVLDPLIDNQFDLMLRQELIPEAPEELQGQDLRVEYVSIMHQAQKLTGLGGVERLTGYVGQLAQLNPESLDKLDYDKLIDTYADMAGTPVEVVREEDEVAALREQRAAQIAAAQAQEQAALQAQNAKTLSETSTEEGTALDAVVRSNSQEPTIA